MNYTLDVLNLLVDIKEDKDIKGLSHAIFPGTHCPLFGVALTASYVEKMFILVVGTSECTYYTKNFSFHRQKGNDRVYSLALKEQDVVFGASKKVKEAVKAIKEYENPQAIMIVTSCVPELIGEDYGDIIKEIKEEENLPVILVNTEHYKCNSHIPGMSRTLTAFSEIMEKEEKNSSVNILGHRSTGVENTELVKLLTKNNIEINAIIPSKCTIKDIKMASKERLNIVTDMIAIELAEKMEKKFGTPFIFFDKHMNRDIITENYKKLENILNIELLSDLQEEIKVYDELFIEVSKLLSGKHFIYGNTPMQAFETAAFLVELGAIPKLIQVRELYEIDKKWKNVILEKGYNPPVTRIANIAPLRELYDKLLADIYIGHENPILLKSKGITQYTFDEHAQKIGYQLPIGIMKSFIEKSKDRKGIAHGPM